MRSALLGCLLLTACSSTDGGADAGASVNYACTNVVSITDAWLGTTPITRPFDFGANQSQVVPCAGTASRPTVAFSWAANASSDGGFTFAVVDNGKSAGLVIAVFPDATCDPATALACGGALHGALQPALAFPVVAGTRYYFTVTSKDATPPTGSFTLRLGN
jgi:hypothetical protein